MKNVINKMSIPVKITPLDFWSNNKHGPTCHPGLGTGLRTPHLDSTSSMNFRQNVYALRYTLYHSLVSNIVNISS